MKIKFIHTTILIVISLTFLLGLTSFMYMLPDGAPGGYTGSPNDGQTCGVSGCHGVTPTEVTGYISSNVPLSGFVPGQLYEITVTVPGTGAKGFEVSPQNTSGKLMGVLTAGTGNKLVNANKSVTHSIAVGINPAVWKFSWTAPVKGTGAVTFYGAFVSTFTNVFKSTLVINENPTAGIHSAIPDNFTFSPNPVSDRVKLDFFLAQKSSVNISVFSIDGRIIKTLYNSSMNQGRQILDFNIKENFKAGIYLIKLSVNGSSIVKKFELK
jgi:hypothetical protein